MPIAGDLIVVGAPIGLGRSHEQCTRWKDRFEPTGVREDYEPVRRVLFYV